MVYNQKTHINILVVEVKDDPNAAVKSQHNEQMVGLWGQDQEVMLGIAVTGFLATPKVLLRKKNELKMICAEKQYDLEKN